MEEGLTRRIDGFYVFGVDEAHDADDADEAADQEERADGEASALVEMQALNNRDGEGEDPPVGYNINDSEYNDRYEGQSPSDSSFRDGGSHRQEQIE